MRFMSGDPEVPVLVRLARNLLIVQAAFFLMQLALIALFAVIAGAGTATANTDATVSPGIDTAVTVIAMVAFGLLGRGVGTLDPRARWGAIGLELLFLFGSVFPKMIADPVSQLIPLVLCAGVLVLLFLPTVTVAFATAPQAPAVSSGAEAVAPGMPPAEDVPVLPDAPAVAEVTPPA